MFDREKMIRAVIRNMFWTQTIDFDTTPFETAENKEIASRAIDIARQQLPRRCLFDEKAIYQRCVELFRIGAYHFYKHWC